MHLTQPWWSVALRRKPCGTILSDKATPFEVVPNPPGMYAADPFILERDGKVYIFAELFPAAIRKGEIGYCVYENGVFSSWETVLSDNYHFSYPYLFEYDGNVYMMPETSRASEIAVYVAIDFPKQWKKAAVLYSGEGLVDSILLPDRHVLSYRLGKGEPNSLSLFEYVGEEAELREVGRRTDETDVMRPGGAAFSYNGMTVRPAQDGRKGYGGALEFIAIEKQDYTAPRKSLGRLEYMEISLNDSRLELNGTHTYNGTENYEVIDVQYRKFDVGGVVKRVKMKIKSICSGEGN